MVDNFVTFLILVIVGAIIGGATNALAIKMLFRPFYPVYIGKWRLPFTPGLIPKRRDALAKQLGDVVVDHLLTAEGIKTRVKNEQFHHEMLTMVQKKLQTFLDSDQTIVELADRLVIENICQHLELVIGNKVKEKYHQWVEKRSGKTIEDVIPESLQLFVEEKIPALSSIVMEKVVGYFDSGEGKRKIAELIDRFFSDKGTFGSMIQMFLGNDSLLNKVHPEVMKFLRQKATKELLEQLIRKEWLSLKKQRLDAVSDVMNHANIAEWVEEQFLRQLDLSAVLQTPLRRLSAPYQTAILKQWLPKAFALFADYFSENIESFLGHLQLDDIVKEQVESFSVQRLETIILAIARRELKMITYLGALLGGLIGAVQGVFLLFV